MIRELCWMVRKSIELDPLRKGVCWLMEDLYTFDVCMTFRVKADNKHDALALALQAESSLNDSSVLSIGGRDTLIRTKIPTMRGFRKIVGNMPTEPARRSVPDEIDRRRGMLLPLLNSYIVKLEWRGDRKTYGVEAPSEKAAIDKARVNFYHDRGHMGAEVEVLYVEKV